MAGDGSAICDTDISVDMSIFPMTFETLQGYIANVYHYVYHNIKPNKH